MTLNAIPSPSAEASLAQEIELLRRIADKDRRAFELLYRTYYRRLTRFLDQVTHRPHLTEEILNDTMFVVWRKAATFDATCKVSTWIFAIAYRKALKALKGLHEAFESASEQAASTGEGPESEAIRQDVRARIGRALAVLSREHRAVVEMTYYHGYAYQEIAEIVGCPVSTVKTRMFYARRKLKELLWIDQGETQ